MNLRLAQASAVLLLLSISGCGGGLSQEEFDQQKRSMELFNEGIGAFEDKHYAQAKDSFAGATEIGALRADFDEIAMVKLAICQAATGEADEGVTTLETLKSKYSYLEDELSFLVAKAYVHAKKGDRAGANQAWNQARRIDPKARRFRE